jgi:hypothetical protein
MSSLRVLASVGSANLLQLLLEPAQLLADSESLHGDFDAASHLLDRIYQVLNEAISSHFCQQPAHLQHALAPLLGLGAHPTTPYLVRELL